MANASTTAQTPPPPKPTLDDRRKDTAKKIIKKLRDAQEVGDATEQDIKEQKKANKQSLGHEGE